MTTHIGFPMGGMGGLEFKYSPNYLTLKQSNWQAAIPISI